MNPKKAQPGDSASSSVRHRVLVGLAAIIAIFSSLTIYSIVLHQRSVEKISLINSSYLPLILGTSEISASQMVFNIFMDRLVDDPNQSVTREWIDAARRFRPSTLSNLIERISKTLENDIPKEEADFLVEMKKRLNEVGRRYMDNEGKFQGLYDLMDTGHVDDARAQVESLKRVERLLNQVLAGIGDEVGQHIKGIADEAEREGTRATWGLSLLTAAGIVIAGALIVSTNRLLTPLKTLQEAVGKVAKGELDTHLDIERQDEIGALAEGFNRMTEALAERDQMLIRSERLATAGKMAAQVTHEIRNPLSSLGLNAELLEEELGDVEKKSEARSLLRAMQDEIERLTGITESYLRYSRLPAPAPTFQNLNETISNVLDFMKESIRDRGITIETDFFENLTNTFFDDSQLKQALTNLLLNACESMPKGGVIRVSTGINGEMVEIRVEDTGDGVPPESMERIFESFYSTKNSGTGLGLPLVKQICVAHGGDARCDDTGSWGSRFVLSLPRTQTHKPTEA